MRNIRNPRYAPEFLERKLSPSTIAPLVVQAEVLLIDCSVSTSCPPSFPSPDGLPPLPDPQPPVGPCEPK